MFTVILGALMQSIRANEEPIELERVSPETTFLRLGAKARLELRLVRGTNVKFQWWLHYQPEWQPTNALPGETNITLDISRAEAEHGATFLLVASNTISAVTNEFSVRVGFPPSILP